MNSAQPTQLVFPIVVWGRQYVQTFLDLALPTFLAPGNLPHCAKTVRTRLIVLTTKEDAETIKLSAAMQYAMTVCEVEVRPAIGPDLMAQYNKYGVMASLHHQVVKEVEGTDAVLGILSPDCVVSEGCLKGALARVEAGYQAVLVAGPRATLQPVARKLRASSDGTLPYISLSPRQLVTALCENLHPVSQSVIFSSQPFSTMPSCLYWIASSTSFVARYFHLHPLMVRVRPDSVFSRQHTGTVDSTLLDDATVPPEQCYVCEDSDEMVVVELTDEKAVHIPSRRRSFKSPYIYWWSRKWANRRHVGNFLNHTFKFRGADGADLVDVMRRADNDTRLLRFMLQRLN